MSVETLTRPLPTTSGRPFMTDGGLETTMVFLKGIDLPLFAAFPMLESAEGRAELDAYAEHYIDIARRHGAGFVLETPTWRASHGWTSQLGYTAQQTEQINRRAIELARSLAAKHGDVEIVVSGNIGPAGDGYAPETMMNPDQAEAYHAPQINAFATAGADVATALTMTHSGEATGIVRAARKAGLPVVISFTVETDGRLPSGQTLGDAITEVDTATDGCAAYFGINCAHPDHFAEQLAGPWVKRIRMVRANASRMSHEELDNSEVLDSGNPAELGRDYARLATLLPEMSVMGGCCGTDHRHVGEIASACLH